MAGEFSVEYDEVTRVAGQLAEITDALAAATGAAADVHAVASPGFTSVDAALECARAWLAEVERLGGRVDQARTGLAASLTEYRDTDQAGQHALQSIDAGLGG